MQEKVINKIIRQLKASDYGVTAVKVELEAQLNRGEDENRDCHECDAEGHTYCSECEDGSVYSEDADGNPSYDDCDNCGGEGRFTCDFCDGDGYIQGASYDEDYCYDHIRDNVSQAARDALVFDKFYDDGSVDSEYTFTVMVDNIKYIPEFVTAFKQLADDIGEGCDTTGAGMHIAVLNSPDGNYPRGNSINYTRYRNFANAMRPLLPALYFLASPDSKSRPLGYRLPDVRDDDKYYAISGASNCFEYRVFETCYDRPEAIFDNLAVIAKTLQFYKLTATDTKANIGDLVLPDRGYELKRFYFSEKHIDALRHGLKYLKPDHKSITTLLRERDFDIRKSELRKQQAQKREEYRKDYQEYKERQKFSRKITSHRAKARYFEYCEHYGSSTTAERYGQIRDYVRAELNSQNNVRSLTQYIQYRLSDVSGETVRVWPTVYTRNNSATTSVKHCFYS